MSRRDAPSAAHLCSLLVTSGVADSNHAAAAAAAAAAAITADSTQAHKPNAVPASSRSTSAAGSALAVRAVHTRSGSISTGASAIAAVLRAHSTCPSPLAPGSPRSYSSPRLRLISEPRTAAGLPYGGDGDVRQDPESRTAPVVMQAAYGDEGLGQAGGVGVGDVHEKGKKASVECAEVSFNGLFGISAQLDNREGDGVSGLLEVTEEVPLPARVQDVRRLNRSHSEYTLEAAGQREESMTSIAAGGGEGESTDGSVSAAGGEGGMGPGSGGGPAGLLSWPAGGASLLRQAAGPLAVPYEGHVTSTTAPIGLPYGSGDASPLAGAAAAAVVARVLGSGGQEAQRQREVGGLFPQGTMRPVTGTADGERSTYGLSVEEAVRRRIIRPVRRRRAPSFVLYPPKPASTAHVGWWHGRRP